MKKNTMATAIIAGLAGVAGIANISTAVNVNPDGVGQVLLYPYYTVNAGNITALSVVNTTDTGKAVKVRFLDAMNSKETLDFNLYLSEYDVWTGAVFSLDAAGPANIVTSDTSCTVPGIESGIFQIPTLPAPDNRRYFPFRTTLFTDQSTLAAGASSGNARTRTGHVEMLEMGTIDYFAPFGFGFALTHINNRPADCESLERAWLASGTAGGSGIWFNSNGQVDLTPPTGGLFGGAAIVNVANGTYINYNAEAIDGWSVAVNHSAPGNTRPNLADVNGPNGTITSYVFDRGRLITSNWAPGSVNGANAVSAVLMRDALFNEYEVDPGLGAASEWVVTFPTKYLYVTGATAFRAPFTNGWSGCERVSNRIYNREEDTFRVFEFSPAGVDPSLCREANVMWFQRVADAAAASPIHGEPAYRAVPTYLRLFGITQKTFNNGWFWLGFYDEDAVNSAGIPNPLTRPPLVETAPLTGTVADRYYGLPAIGYWALRVININQGAGLQASYGGAYPHRASRACFKGAFDDSAPCD
jgi:hypothetical protein